MRVNFDIRGHDGFLEIPHKGLLLQFRWRGLGYVYLRPGDDQEIQGIGQINLSIQKFRVKNKNLIELT